MRVCALVLLAGTVQSASGAQPIAALYSASEQDGIACAGDHQPAMESPNTLQSRRSVLLTALQAAQA